MLWRLAQAQQALVLRRGELASSRGIAWPNHFLCGQCRIEISCAPWQRTHQSPLPMRNRYLRAPQSSWLLACAFEILALCLGHLGLGLSHRGSTGLRESCVHHRSWSWCHFRLRCLYWWPLHHCCCWYFHSQWRSAKCGFKFYVHRFFRHGSPL